MCAYKEVSAVQKASWDSLDYSRVSSHDNLLLKVCKCEHNDISGYASNTPTPNAKMGNGGPQGTIPWGDGGGGEEKLLLTIKITREPLNLEGLCPALW